MPYLFTSEQRSKHWHAYMVTKKHRPMTAIEIRRANGRPYVSATRILKPLGFDGSKPLDVEAVPYNSHGFEFKVA